MYRKTETVKRVVPKRAFWAAMLALSALANVPLCVAAPSCDDAPTDPACLYASAYSYPDSAVQTIATQITYTDVAGQSRDVPIAIRFVPTAPKPLPVVIWAHGGEARANANPLSAMDRPGMLAAKAGYIAISTVHLKRSPANKSALCAALDVATDSCRLFINANYDRPKDISAVIDKLPTLVPISALVDVTKIVVGGHSHGSGGALMTAGAKRYNANIGFNDGYNNNDSRYLATDSRPLAFIALSPQAGLGATGFFDTTFRNSNHTWRDITRPVLLATGDGDNVCEPTVIFCLEGDSPAVRRVPFLRMPAGAGGPNKYQLYIQDPLSFHTMFQLETKHCDASELARCQEIVSWLSSTILAFLDAQLRSDSVAIAWLASDNVANAGAGSAEWSVK